MDQLQEYPGSPDMMYHLLEDNDSGVEELPFAAYSTLYEIESPTLMSSELFNLACFGGTHDDKSLNEDDDDGDDEDDLEYIDDDEDEDYRPSKTSIFKKGKGKYKKPRHLRTIDMSMMFTPPKRSDSEAASESTVRHYARKDRTPRTIMKMMEKHRESERVRHHTLNESMKYICSRVPGYDPFAKETKVIQMQRIIGYECFLENTINNLCENIGIKRKLLGINTNFITEAMKDKKPEEWFKIGPVDMAGNDDEDSLLDNSSIDSTNKCVKKTNAPRHYTKYRREKISSPTVDSTTDNIIHLIPSGAPVVPQASESSLDGSWLSQGFRPIQESQESGIKTETQSTIVDTALHDSIDSLFEQGLCNEPDHLKTVTAAFMNDDVAPSSTVDDAMSEFNLSSPIRYNHNKVFLHSPKSSGVWHQPVSLYYGDATELLGSTEMTSISPEYILETKPKIQSRELADFQGEDNSTIAALWDNSSDLQTVPRMPLDYDHEDPSIESFNFSNSYWENNHTLDNVTGSKNKRKRYTPMRAPFKNLSNVKSEEDEEEGQENERCSQKIVKIFKHNIDGMIKKGGKPPIIVISTKKENKTQSLDSQQYHSLSELNQEDQEHMLHSVDHRKSTWMNGFMMFCRLNRSRFISANPGQHSSHIQKIMGQAWREMTPAAQQPYREKARKYSEYVRQVKHQNKEDPQDGANDRLVPTSTTDDLELIIARL